MDMLYIVTRDGSFLRGREWVEDRAAADRFASIEAADAAIAVAVDPNGSQIEPSGDEVEG